jgi:flavin-dependent dehydrogenase
MTDPPPPHRATDGHAPMRLADGSRVAVIGGGPAGALFSYFLLEFAGRAGMRLAVDIYEPRDFSLPGPAGCNMCGGLISETLVQRLASDGIDLPPHVVQRGIDSYVLHMDVGTVRIDPPRPGAIIAAVHRGGGPRGVAEARWRSFDAHLLALATGRGARVVPDRVMGIGLDTGKPMVSTNKGTSESYDLLVGAVGVNTTALRMFEGLFPEYKAPGTTKTYIGEFFLGEETIRIYLGSAMHVFLPNLPRLEFAALIPKGEYVTVVMLGKEIDKPLVDRFLSSCEVLSCFPPDWAPPADFCHCAPAINIAGAVRPYADRVVLIGDSGVSRLYKDGLGGAYRTAKAAAVTAVFEGVSKADFRRHYLPVCRAMAIDNRVGKVIFGITRLIQRMAYARRGVLRMTHAEQVSGSRSRRMSGVLWDTFTGSAPYQDVFRRFVHPVFLARLAWETLSGSFRDASQGRGEAD